jgi:hypothetical protein
MECGDISRPLSLPSISLSLSRARASSLSLTGLFSGAKQGFSSQLRHVSNSPMKNRMPGGCSPALGPTILLPPAHSYPLGPAVIINNKTLKAFREKLGTRSANR